MSETRVSESRRTLDDTSKKDIGRLVSRSHKDINNHEVTRLDLRRIWPNRCHSTYERGSRNEWLGKGVLPLAIVDVSHVADSVDHKYTDNCAT